MEKTSPSWQSRSMSVSRDKIAEGPWKTDSFPLFILLHISHVKDGRPKWAAGQCAVSFGTYRQWV